MYNATYLYRIFEARRKELGLKQEEVGQLVTGRPDSSVLQNIRRGAVPSIKRVSEICDVLELECYVGPQRQKTGNGDYARTGRRNVTDPEAAQ